MNLLPQILISHLFCVFMIYGHFWDACHREAYQTWPLSVWKAPEGPDTLEISHDSGFRTESPESPVELG